MLSKALYDLSLILSPYSHNQIDSIANNIDDFSMNEIYLKKLFNIEWRKKLNSSITQIDSRYTYSVIDQNSKFIKVKFNIKNSFALKSLQNNIPSCCVDKYVLIIEYLNDRFKINLLINKEENPFLYNSALNYDLNEIDTLLSLSLKNLWLYNLNNIDSLYKDFISYTSFPKYNRIKKRTSNFNVLTACDYAEKFALNPNPNYKTFAGIGGDCTNFVSQIIHAGGIDLTASWKPYANPWIRVEDLYSYLISHNIGMDPLNESALSKGDIIQFYTPKSGRFFHTGFITYELKEDYLYCCHSYNKLNYPLSAIYPIIYPKLRCIKIK